jgi:putative mRNA 3-end processing factor
LKLLTYTEKGLYCAQGGFYIDPWKTVPKAVITHAHADHAYPGHKYYLAQHFNKPILKLRLGHNIHIETVEYGEETVMNGVKISFHPAGHIIGSAQVRIEYKGEIWVVSGDYKPEPDGISTPFEPIFCHNFITESTFGMPIYNWQDQNITMREINDFWQENKNNGFQTVILGYSLGKAQRIIKYLDESIGPIFLHDSIHKTQQVLIKNGHDFLEHRKLDLTIAKSKYEGALIMAPPMAAGSGMLQHFAPYKLAMCSGWMQVRSAAAKRKVDRGFVLSDHADWNGLLNAVKATEAETVYVTHGFSKIFSKYLNEIGINAIDVDTFYNAENIEE